MSSRRKPPAKPRTKTAITKAPPKETLHPPSDPTFDVGAVVFEANSRLRAIGAQHEGLCVYLVNALFGGDAQKALSKKALLEQRYLTLRARAGKSLELDADELREHTRVGAVYLLRPNDDAWRGIAWSEKLELLPLLALDDDRKKFNEGVLFAARPNVGREHVRKFVQDATPRLPGSVGAARGAEVTIAKSAKFAETGVQLGSAKQREALARQIEEAPPAKRKELVRDLRKTLQNLGELLDLIDEGEDDGK